MLTRNQIDHEFRFDLESKEPDERAGIVVDLFCLQLAGRRHGRAGWYPDGDFSSDADWCYGVGAQIARLESLLDIDDGSIGDLYSDAHSQYFRDGTINPDERSWISGPEAGIYDFQFGAYGDTKVRVHAGSRDDALETAAEWLADNAPGLFSEPDYDDAAKDLEITGDWRQDETLCQQVQEAAEVDHTYTESGWLLSYEWFVNGPR